MAVQIDTEELQGCRSYFRWIADKVGDSAPEELLKLMFSTDFLWDIEEDGIRAKDSTDMRKVYAEDVGGSLDKSERDIDRIWKSVHGKCSVLELIVNLCVRMEEMVNEGEAGEMVPDFFRILCGNLGVFDKKLIRCDGPEGNQISQGWHSFNVPLAQTEHWTACILRFMNRKYEADGSGGGLFPLEKWSAESGKDQRKVPIWYQMNTWLDENLDEDEHFMIEKWNETRKI